MSLALTRILPAFAVTPNNIPVTSDSNTFIGVLKLKLNLMSDIIELVVLIVISHVKRTGFSSFRKNGHLTAVTPNDPRLTFHQENR